MKGLKFRAWHKQAKHYFEVVELDFRLLLVCLYNNDKEVFMEDFDEVIIEQFTGIHDKNHKEIYEGDIIIYDFVNAGTEPVIGNVVYSAYHAAYGIVPLAYKDSIEWFGELAINAPLEVIGNIHESSK